MLSRFLRRLYFYYYLLKLVNTASSLSLRCDKSVGASVLQSERESDGDGARVRRGWVKAEDDSTRLRTAQTPPVID